MELRIIDSIGWSLLLAVVVIGSSATVLKRECWDMLKFLQKVQ